MSRQESFNNFIDYVSSIPESKEIQDSTIVKDSPYLCDLLKDF